MKRLLILAIVALLSSCAAPYTTLYYTDFTRYADEGMFVTPFAEYSGHKYRPIANFTVEHYEGGNAQEKTDFQEMADALVAAAKSVGANGVMEFNVRANLTTWYASGTAVIFEDMPTIPQPEQTMIEYKGEELIARTVEYCNARNIELFSFSGDLWSNTVYDINTHRYIAESLYKEKYGDDIINGLKKALRASKKSKK